MVCLLSRAFLTHADSNRPLSSLPLSRLPLERHAAENGSTAPLYVLEWEDLSDLISFRSCD